jgi:hypothetical protein
MRLRVQVEYMEVERYKDGDGGTGAAVPLSSDENGSQICV